MIALNLDYQSGICHKLCHNNYNHSACNSCEYEIYDKIVLELLSIGDLIRLLLEILKAVPDYTSAICPESLTITCSSSILFTTKIIKSKIKYTTGSSLCKCVIDMWECAHRNTITKSQRNLIIEIRKCIITFDDYNRFTDVIQTMASSFAGI